MPRLSGPSREHKAPLVRKATQKAARFHLSFAKYFFFFFFNREREGGNKDHSQKISHFLRLKKCLFSFRGAGACCTSSIPLQHQPGDCLTARQGFTAGICWSSGTKCRETTYLQEQTCMLSCVQSPPTRKHLLGTAPAGICCLQGSGCTLVKELP